jgi:hypothetical protein
MKIAAKAPHFAQELICNLFGGLLSFRKIETNH